MDLFDLFSPPPFLRWINPFWVKKRDIEVLHSAQDMASPLQKNNLGDNSYLGTSPAPFFFFPPFLSKFVTGTLAWKERKRKAARNGKKPFLLSL